MTTLPSSSSSPTPDFASLDCGSPASLASWFSRAISVRLAEIRFFQLSILTRFSCATCWACACTRTPRKRQRFTYVSACCKRRAHPGQIPSHDEIKRQHAKLALGLVHVAVERHNLSFELGPLRRARRCRCGFGGGGLWGALASCSFLQARCARRSCLGAIPQRWSR